MIAPDNLSPVEHVRRLGQTDSKGRLARWASEVCPSTVGLPPAFDDFIDKRIKNVAVEVGAYAAGPSCRPNVLIIVSPNANLLTQRVIAKKLERLDAGRWGVDHSGLQAFTTGDKPVHWFYVADTAEDVGGSVNSVNAASISAAGEESGLDRLLSNSASPGAPSYSSIVPSRLKPTGDETFSEIVIVVDASRVAGLRAGQLADYLSMVALSNVRGDASFSGTDTILNLFEKHGQPAALTNWDKAYLSGLYQVDGQVSYSSQVSHIVSWMQLHSGALTTNSKTTR